MYCQVRKPSMPLPTVDFISTLCLDYELKLYYIALARPHSSRRRAARLRAFAACVRCAAPQHERGGEGGAVCRAKGEQTCGCRKRGLRRGPCFRPVIYRELCNSSA